MIGIETRPWPYRSAIIGYRTWAIDESGWLEAPFKRRRWRGPIAHARCHPDWFYDGVKMGLKGILTRHAPHPDHCCGLYAYHEPRTPHFDEVAGAVVCWGRVLIHSKGVRAQHMRILALAVPRGLVGPTVDPRPSHVALAGERYRVPVLSHADELPAFASEYGVIVPEHRRPAS
ncbi:MAG: hypothetical protein ACRD2Z_09685 [Thermoanaerobaculia bacterium]